MSNIEANEKAPKADIDEKFDLPKKQKTSMLNQGSASSGITCNVNDDFKKVKEEAKIKVSEVSEKKINKVNLKLKEMKLKRKGKNKERRKKKQQQKISTIEQPKYSRMTILKK